MNNKILFITHQLKYKLKYSYFRLNKHSVTRLRNTEISKKKSGKKRMIRMHASSEYLYKRPKRTQRKWRCSWITFSLYCYYHNQKDGPLLSSNQSSLLTRLLFYYFLFFFFFLFFKHFGVEINEPVSSTYHYLYLSLSQTP